MKSVHHLRLLPSLALLLGFCLLSRSGLGQAEQLKALTDPFDQYRNQTLQEKLFVHTDRSFYLAGETLWFKVYNVDGTAHQPLDLSQVVYLEVLDAEQVPVLQTKVALQEGTGHGSLALPVSLLSGHYRVRAYTNWMKNFPAAYYFEKPLTVVNTFKQLGLKPVASAATFDVQFFPEGGHLVSELSSKVAFKVTDHQGKGVVAKGLILNRQNDTLARFEPLALGIGHFTFTPVAGQEYRAQLRGPGGQTITRSLPIVQEQGLVMQLTEEDPDQLRVRVSSRYLSGGSLSRDVYLLVHTRQETKLAEMRPLDGSGEASFTIPKNVLGDGISHFTVFNRAGQPVCERLYFQRPRQRLVLEASTDQASYAPRSQVRLDFTTQDAVGNPEAADLSVSVYRLDSLQRPEARDFLTYLWLTSDLPGVVERPEYYLATTSPETDAALDNLMLTHGWRRFRWEEVLSRKEAFSFVHPPEYGGHQIRGRVLHKKTNEPAPNILTYLASPSRQTRLYGSRSNRKGEILFDVKDFYGPRDLILQTNTRRDSTYRFEVASPFSPEPSPHRLPAFDLSESLRAQLQERSIHLQVQNANSAATPGRFRVPVADSTVFFGKPDKTYFLDDYTRFPVMEEVMREYVQPVMVRKRRGQYHFLVVNEPHKGVFQADPLVLLDGVPVFETDKIMAYDPRKVQKLEVATRLYLHGPLTFNGIVSYTTYSGGLPDFPIDPRSLLVDYEGLQVQREFYSPQYDTPQQAASRLPDLRTLLHWVPSLLTTGDGKGQVRFFTGDQQGQYVVVVHGLTKSGKAGSSSLTFDVKRPL